MIHLGETLPAKLEGERREIRWGTLLLLIGVLFPCSLVSFGIGAPTGAVMATVPAQHSSSTSTRLGSSSQHAVSALPEDILSSYRTHMTAQVTR